MKIAVCHEVLQLGKANFYCFFFEKKTCNFGFFFKKKLDFRNILCYNLVKIERKQFYQQQRAASPKRKEKNMSRWRRNYNSGWYGCSGGYSRSRGAEIAESNGMLPLTRAIPEVARKAGVTQKKAKEILKEFGPSEWHHTGRYYQRTWYYDIEGAVEFWQEKETEREKA